MVNALKGWLANNTVTADSRLQRQNPRTQKYRKGRHEEMLAQDTDLRPETLTHLLTQAAMYCYP